MELMVDEKVVELVDNWGHQLVVMKDEIWEASVVDMMVQNLVDLMVAQTEWLAFEMVVELAYIVEHLTVEMWEYLMVLMMDYLVVLMVVQLVFLMERMRTDNLVDVMVPMKDWQLVLKMASQLEFELGKSLVVWMEMCQVEMKAVLYDIHWMQVLYKIFHKKTRR